MATPSSILAWERPCTEEPGRLQSLGSQRILSDLTTATTLFNGTFQLIEYSSFSFCSLCFRSLDDASVSFLLISVFLRKTMTVTYVYTVYGKLKKFS